MAFFSVNFIFQKFCQCKKMTNIRYGNIVYHLRWSQTGLGQALGVEFRGPKSLNFPDGKIQRAKTFRTKCVNRFRNKKCVNCFSRQIKCVKRFLRQEKCVNRFSLQIKCINHFCDKKVHKIAIWSSSQKGICCFCNIITIFWWNNQ